MYSHLQKSKPTVESTSVFERKKIYDQNNLGGSQSCWKKDVGNKLTQERNDIRMLTGNSEDTRLPW